jgi:hypothetical protein
MKYPVNVISTIQGPGLLPVVEAYMRLAPPRAGVTSTVLVSRVFEWRKDGVAMIGTSALPEARNYGNGIQRLSSGSAGVTKASPKE